MVCNRLSFFTHNEICSYRLNIFRLNTYLSFSIVTLLQAYLLQYALKYSQIIDSACFTWRRPTVRSRSRNLEEDNAACVYPDIGNYNSAQFKTVLVFSARLLRCTGLASVFRSTLHEIWPFWEFVMWRSIQVIRNPLLLRFITKSLNFALFLVSSSCCRWTQPYFKTVTSLTLI
jgi:hypothetical protein